MSEKHDSCEQYADVYDEKSVESGWHGPAILFGLMYAHVQPDQALLDLGIGTGLGSELFHKAGLRITGIDTSVSMLNQCQRKGLPFELINHNLAHIPWPCASGSFDHAVSTGVLHFVGELHSIFAEIARLLKPGGLFGFDFDEYTADENAGYDRVVDGVYCRLDREYGEKLFRHQEEYVHRALVETGFAIVDETEFLVSKERKSYFKAIIARRQ